MTDYFVDSFGWHEVSYTDAEGYSTEPHYGYGEETIYVDSDDVCDFDWCDAD